MKTCDVEFLRQMHCIVRRLNEDDMLGFDSILPEHFIEAEKVTKEHEVAHSEMQTGFYVLLKKSLIFWGEYS